MLRVSLLGSLSVSDADGRPMTFRRAASQELFAYLVLNMAGFQPRTHVAYSLWPSVDDDTARARLRQAVHWLLTDLPPPSEPHPWLLAHSRTSLRWNPDAIQELDVRQLATAADLLAGDRRAAVAGAPRQPCPLGAIDAFNAYRGDLLADWSSAWIDPWRNLQAARLRQIGEALLRCHLTSEEQGRLREVVARLNAEPAERWQHVSGTLSSLARHLDALAAATRSTTAKTSPPPRPRALTIPAHGIRQADRSLPPGDDPTMPLVDRDDLANVVATAIDLNPLVTLVGAPGVGKSVLARAVMNRGQAPPGLVADCASTIDGEALWSVVRAVLQTGETTAVAGSTDAAVTGIAARLTAGHGLLLDNVDAVHGDVADLVERILRQSGARRILVTARAPLRVDGEVVVRVPPLAAGEARRLLAARAASPFDETLTHAIIAAMDGLPLGLVIAATCCSAAPTDPPLATLQTRPDLLTQTGGLDDVRHRNLATAIAPVWYRLSAEEQRLLAWLAAHRRPATLGDVIVAGDGMRDRLPVPIVIHGLVTQSIVEADDSDAFGMPRYRVLRPIATFALAHAAST